MRGGDVLTPAGELLAACVGAGPPAVASHRSAAWLWGLVGDAPPRPEITVALTQRPRRPNLQVHRRGDIDPASTSLRRAVPCTNPLRTLADLGEVDPASLDGAVDRALAVRLVTVEGLLAEIDRLSRTGRRGVGVLRRSLERRGMVEAPAPSVLESMTLRLLARWGIRPLDVQVVVLGGRYRLDILIRPGLALEVDGFAFHSSPEAKAADSVRRNALRLEGIVVIEANWVTITREPETLHAMLLAYLARTPGRLPQLPDNLTPSWSELS